MFICVNWGEVPRELAREREREREPTCSSYTKCPISAAASSASACILIMYKSSSSFIHKSVRPYRTIKLLKATLIPSEKNKIWRRKSTKQRKSNWKLGRNRTKGRGKSAIAASRSINRPVWKKNNQKVQNTKSLLLGILEICLPMSIAAAFEFLIHQIVGETY